MCAIKRESAAAKRMHDLDPITFAERVAGMQAARNDLAIDLHRDPAFGQALSDEQGRQGSVGSHFQGLSVQFYLHARIVTDP